MIDRAAILAAVPPDGRAEVARAFAALDAARPPWEARRNRLDRRDDLVRQAHAAALGARPALGATLAAKAVARAWERARRGQPDGSALADLAVEIVALHGDGGAVTWQHVARIVREGRTPPCA